jgi:hypothetical protein
MKYSQTIGVVAGIILIYLCFQKWVYIESPDKYLTGFKSTTAQNPFRSAGKLHVLFGGLSILFFAIPKLWAKRTNFLFVALNLAWAARNLFAIGLTCRLGVCPTALWPLYGLFSMALVMFIMSLLPKLKV